MPKKLVEAPIRVESIDDIHKLSETHNRSQKVIITCPICRKEFESFMYKHHGGIREGLICSFCKRKSTMIERFGSSAMTSSDYFKRKSAETKLKRYGDKNFNNPDKQKETMLKVYGGIGFASKELLEKQRNTMYQKYGFYNPMESYEIIRKMKSRYFFDGQKFDSSWEIYLYIWLKDNHIDFIYQPELPDFEYTYNGKTYTYIPDFLIKDEIIEIKGDQFFEDGKMISPFHREDDGKVNAKYEFAISKGVKFYRYDDIKPYEKYVKNLYGKNYVKQFKN